MAARDQHAPNAQSGAEPGTIFVSGEMARLASQVESASMTVGFELGRVLGPDMTPTQVLVPMMTCRLTGEFGPERLKAEPTATLVFDNVAFLIFQIAREYSNATRTVQQISRTGLTPPAERVEHAADWLSKASNSLERAAQRLRALVAVEPEPAADRKPRGGKATARTNVKPAAERESRTGRIRRPPAAAGRTVEKA